MMEAFCCHRMVGTMCWRAGLSGIDVCVACFYSVCGDFSSAYNNSRLESKILKIVQNSLFIPFCPFFYCLQMSNKRSNSFRRAILQGSRQLKGCSLRDEVGLGLPQRLVRHVAYETLPREVDRKWYFDSYTYCPPPWLILAITIAEVHGWGDRDTTQRGPARRVVAFIALSITHG